ncbi:MAG: hypothetical protein OEU92_17140 [Alphaproteobacteria bacterium]|nr:hypothetical protein [Alphaproteobacteria bacterium]
MSIMERMMNLMMERMSKEDKESMMDSMMEKFFADITPEEKQHMMAEMMPKMMEGMNMADMMPKMMMGMMSGRGGDGQGGMEGMMSGMMKGGSGPQMQEMMLRTMMPNCIQMMLPAIDAEKRGEVATEIISALVSKGTEGMSDEQRTAFRQTLGEALKAVA